MKQALIVVDVQESFRQRPYFRDEELPRFLRNVQSLVNRCTARGIAVEHLHHRNAARGASIHEGLHVAQEPRQLFVAEVRSLAEGFLHVDDDQRLLHGLALPPPDPEQSATSCRTPGRRAIAAADAYRSKMAMSSKRATGGAGLGPTLRREAPRFTKLQRFPGRVCMLPHQRLKSVVLPFLAVSGLGLTLCARAADQPPPEIPTCDKKIGTLAVTEPENKWWLQYNLESPEALIKVFVSQSKCFTLLDRGKGLAAAQQERALAGSGEMRGGSNLGGLVGGLLGGVAGAVVGGISLKSKTADVVLTMTDVRSTEQVAMQQGHAKKTDLGWGAGGGAFFGGFAAAGASSYANTEIGQVVTMAYLDAFTKLVNQVKGQSPNAKADNVTQSVTMARPGKMYASASIKAKVVRELDPGMTLYPSGEKDGLFWKVSDELGNEGWVPSTLFQLAK